jgi:RNase P subunit RPR2
MEILYKGTLPGDMEYQVTCINCKSILKFKRCEAIETTDWREGSYLRVTCPVCESSITKSASDYIKPHVSYYSAK